jgi:hypothetical protein
MVFDRLSLTNHIYFHFSDHFDIRVCLNTLLPEKEYFKNLASAQKRVFISINPCFEPLPKP